MFEDWMKLGLSALALGVEAHQVAALRLWQLATGSHHRDETQRMVSEKIETFVDASRAAAISAARGHTLPFIAVGVLGTYRKRVRRNARRLMK